MRLGIFGGTFDPIHLAHLVLAEQCREQGRLDEVRFLVAARPPHKPEPTASFAQRVEMLELAIASRDLRRRLREGRSVRYLIPRAVEAYIADKGLYRNRIG